MDDWIDVRGKLPEIGEKCFVLNIRTRRVGTAVYRDGLYKNWLADDASVEVVVTHWMPIPELPKPPEETAGFILRKQLEILIHELQMEVATLKRQVESHLLDCELREDELER